MILKSKVTKCTQFAYDTYVLGLQRQKVESVVPDTKLPSLATTGERTRTSESWILTQHLSLKSAFMTTTRTLSSHSSKCGKTNNTDMGKTHSIVSHRVEKGKRLNHGLNSALSSAARSASCASSLTAQAAGF